MAEPGFGEGQEQPVAELAAVRVEAHSHVEHLHRVLEPAGPVEYRPAGAREIVPFPLDQVLEARSRLFDLREPAQRVVGPGQRRRPVVRAALAEGGCRAAKFDSWWDIFGSPRGSRSAIPAHAAR